MMRQVGFIASTAVTKGAGSVRDSAPRQAMLKPMPHAADTTRWKSFRLDRASEAWLTLSYAERRYPAVVPTSSQQRLLTMKAGLFDLPQTGS